MKKMMAGWNWIHSIRRSRSLENGLDEEMRFHIDEQAERYRLDGTSADEARRQALVRFGGLEPVKESTRDRIRPVFLDDTARDIRHGFRLLRRAPGFTSVALITLALGIGATSAIFSVVRTVMLTPLPYPEPDRVVTVWETNRGGTSRNVIAPANFVAWRERTRTLERLGMIGLASLSMVVDGQPDRISGLQVSGDVFRALDAQPVVGRAYTQEEDFSDARVIVLSHEFWQRRLAGRQDVLGLSLATESGPRTVIGIMPPDFTVVGERFNFLIPYGQSLEQLRAVRGRGGSYAIARLADGVSFEQAYRELRQIYAALEREEPQRNARRSVMLFRVHDQMVGDLRPAVIVLVGAVGLVLLVACVNIANLLLARSATREREVGLRTALGAAHARLVRQMLTESVVLSICGGLAGLAIAAWCHRGLLALVGDKIPIPRLDQISLDLTVVAFTMLVALATGLMFGLVPAFLSTSHASDALRAGGRHGGGRRLHRVLNVLVVAEVAVSLVLLTGAGLLLRSFLKLQNVDPGFRANGVLTASIPLPATHYDLVQGRGFFRDSLTRISALRGVDHAAGSSCQPVPLTCIGTNFWRVDRPRPADGELSAGQIRPVTPGFFKTLAIPQIAGRDFSDSDTAESVPVAIVSEEVARLRFPDGSPLGRRLRINVDHVNGRDDVEWTVVGIVGNVRSNLDGPIRETIFIPTTQRPSLFMTLFVRTHGDPASIAPAVRTVIQSIEPEAPVTMRTLEDVVGSSIARPRVISVLVSLFAIVALVLAAVGVYGVMAYSVRERTQEIGVRMALGASGASVFRLVVGQALHLVIIGVVAGLIAAGALTRILASLLFQIEPLDPWTFAVTALILLGVAAVASYVPARREMRMAPADALRAN